MWKHALLLWFLSSWWDMAYFLVLWTVTAVLYSWSHSCINEWFMLTRFKESIDVQVQLDISLILPHTSSTVLFTLLTVYFENFPSIRSKFQMSQPINFLCLWDQHSVDSLAYLYINWPWYEHNSRLNNSFIMYYISFLPHAGNNLD